MNMTRTAASGFLAAATLLVGMSYGIAQQGGNGGNAPDWRDDWELADGLSMEMDSQGYNFPSHIMFVPDPGPDPKDPLYFVLELKGQIKVVANDRSVHTFADSVLPVPQGPTSFDQVGLTGICLEPENGYVFVTFAYLDHTQVYRNGMARYTTTPGTFGLSGSDRLDFLDLFRNERAATAHQIGPCQVRDGHVYAAVGYGDEKAQAQNLHSTLGSIIRMTLDFKSSPDNPFYEDDGKDTAIDYIWAYGFRNVFGLKFVGDRLFATENGGDVDRFNEIEKGQNYLWNGTDWGIGARAVQTFVPAVGIVHLDYIPNDTTLFPAEYAGKFVSPSSGTPGEVGRSVDGKRSILLIDYDFDLKRMASVPREILSYRGKGMQIPVSVALGPDGLYFLPIFPNSAGIKAVYRVTYDPAKGYPHRIGSDESPLALINKYGCRQCHSIAGAGGAFGPKLDAERFASLRQRVTSPDYAKQVAEVDAIDAPPFNEFKDARARILDAEGEARVELWLQTYLQEPTFDNPRNPMPRLDVTPQHAKIVADHLLGQGAVVPTEQQYGLADRLRFYIAAKIPELRYRHVLLAFALGGVLGAIAIILPIAILRRRRRSV